MDHILIKHLQCSAVIGCLPEEQEAPQPLFLNITLELDLQPAARTDNLADTVDYAALADALRRHAAASRYQLIETLAERLAAICLEDNRVQSVELEIEKPQAIRQAECAAVRIFRKSPGKK